MISKELKIEIRPIPNRNNIKQFSENLEYFSQSNTISAFVNPVSLKYETGLTDLVDRESGSSLRFGMFGIP